jgi:hypothetical protein
LNDSFTSSDDMNESFKTFQPPPQRSGRATPTSPAGGRLATWHGRLE